MSPDDTDNISDLTRAPRQVLAFHKLLDRFSYSSTNYSPRRFVQLIRRLTEAGFSFNASDRGSSDKRLLITFDDGYEHLAEVLPPLMDKFSLHPLIFVPTANIGKDNTWDYSHWFQSTPHLDRRQIKVLSGKGAMFGSHGHSHRSLTGLSDGALKGELELSKAVLEDICGTEVNSLSYPFGRVDRRVREAAVKAGFRSGYTMKFPSMNDTPLARGRFSVYGFDSSFTILQRLKRGPLYPIEKAKAGFVNFLSGGTVLLHRLSGRGEAVDSSVDDGR
ncbi:MAG TPA: polysaccharide deacetylase family protein [candidate division Zixibacteria bacterium]|nr:polysaccharide deacetylase family protein [candidate division Zixibacteria bacterium]